MAQVFIYIYNIAFLFCLIIIIGFKERPLIIGLNNNNGINFKIRVKPNRCTDIIKCVISHKPMDIKFKKKHLFWKDTTSYILFNVSHTNIDINDNNEYIDLLFNDLSHFYHNLWVYCSTSVKSMKETSLNSKYSSLIIPTNPSVVHLKLI